MNTAPSSTATALLVREQRLIGGPVLPVLVSLALPNMIAMASTASVTVAETTYVGRLGREPLGAIAIVFPFTMLMQNLSAGGIGGGITSAVSRALGANDCETARALAIHSAIIALAAGLTFTVFFLLFGTTVYQALGASGDVLTEALRYSVPLFSGSIAIWFTNALISVLRGTGNMRVPAMATLSTSATQVTLGATLGLGLGPMPRLGMTGVALGQVLASTATAVWLLYYMRSPRSRIQLRWGGTRMRSELFGQILRVGLLACLSPLQTVIIVVILTGLIARLGVDALAGYGIGVRLEFLLIPIAFGVGVSTVPMVGMALGRGDVARARRVAWTGGALSASLLGLIGAVVTIWPHSWAGLYTQHVHVLAYATQYLRFAGPGYACFGVGLTLFFASQGAGRVLGPVLAASLRLIIIAAGGFALQRANAPAASYFQLIAVAMTLYGIVTVISIARSDWRPRAAPARGR